MGAFSWLKQALKQHQQGGCKATPEAESFVSEYDNQIEISKQLLKDRQEQKRQELSSGCDR